MRRTNEEFKAEVFSRSEKYIEQRKKKRKSIGVAISCIVPLVLCVVILFPYMSFGNNANDESVREPTGNGGGIREDYEASVGHTKEEAAEDILDGSSDEDKIVGISVSEYPNKDNVFHKTGCQDLVCEMVDALKNARKGNIGLYDYEKLFQLESDGFIIVLESENGSEQTFILIENYLFVDNVAYEIKEEDTTLITNLVIVAQSLYS